ncbi:MAG: radical SAM protein [Pseudomonadota bacterium]
MLCFFAGIDVGIYTKGRLRYFTSMLPTIAESVSRNMQQVWMKYGPETEAPLAPETVTIEITTRCNLSCVMCPHGIEGGMPIKTDAPDVLVQSILDSIDIVKEIHPTGVGEPLMAQGFWKIIDAMGGRKEPSIAFHTNGILLTQRNVERLLKTSLSRVNVSVDAATEMTYRRVRGADMRKTIDGISRLAKGMVEKSGSNIPNISMSMVLMRETVEEAPDFVELAHSLGVRFVYFEHLTEPQFKKDHWVVERGNFLFNYKEQELFDDAEYSDVHIIKALDKADELGVVIEGYEVLLSPGNKHHDRRPCRDGSLLQFYTAQAPGMDVQIID